jgi:hypothetical protein
VAGGLPRRHRRRRRRLGAPGGGVDAGDVDRWLEASDLLEGYGLELLEWFVIGDRTWCPRDLLGEPPRW